MRGTRPVSWHVIHSSKATVGMFIAGVTPSDSLTQETVHDFKLLIYKHSYC